MMSSNNIDVAWETSLQNQADAYWEGKTEVDFTKDEFTIYDVTKAEYPANLTIVHHILNDLDNDAIVDYLGDKLLKVFEYYNNSYPNFHICQYVHAFNSYLEILSVIYGIPHYYLDVFENCLMFVFKLEVI